MTTSSEIGRAAEFAACHQTYIHFLSPNDTGLTKSHQAGILMSKSSWPIMFDEQPVRDGSAGNTERFVKILWQDGEHEETNSRFIYYRTGTRNEFRLTRFGRGFKRLKPECTGNLFVLCRAGKDIYKAWTFSTDDDIQAFLDAFGLNPTDTNRLISGNILSPDAASVMNRMTKFAESLVDFPDTETMAAQARKFYEDTLKTQEKSPDELLMRWIDTEYLLFRAIEKTFYTDVVEYGFSSIESFLACAQTILQRRKARAGKSFEHHLGALFTRHHLRYTPQGVTELNKRPDFVFPSIEAYHDSSFPHENVIVLAAKTTCKDRWRQVLSEADKVSTHYLATLQQGISPAQCREMQDSNVRLVVPKSNRDTFPEEFRPSVLTLDEFLSLARRTQQVPSI